MTAQPTRLALASPHRDANEAGREAFVDGGTAVDAALAACATLTVVYPHMCSIGGDLIALLHAPDGTVTAVNASGAAPAALTREIVAGFMARERRARGAGTADREIQIAHGGEPGGVEMSPHGMPVRGPHTVTVPGVLRGWARLHELGGALDWARLLRPAVERAAAGMTVSRGLAATFASVSELVLMDPGLRSVFASAGRLPVEGDLVRQPALAASLKILAHDGPDAFYRGPLGAAFVAGLRAAGSLLTNDDLAAFEVELATPLALTAFGHEFLTAPPNSQGFVLLEMLGVIERLATEARAGRDASPGQPDGVPASRDVAISQNASATPVPLDPLGPDAGALAHLFRLASADRERHLCDPRFRAVPLRDLLGEAHLAELAEQARAGLHATGAASASGDSRGRAGGGSVAGAATDGDTIACVAADSDGWAVSIIQSLYYGFGSGILEPATGIVAQNRGACFSLDPSSPNVIEGGKRPLHTLMPVLAKRGGRLAIVAGTRGGEAQPQIHAQILARLLWNGTAPAAGTPCAGAKDALTAPRWIWDESAVYAEADVPDVGRAALEASGLPFAQLGARDDTVGHANYIRILENGLFDAGGDPRSDGEALLVERP